MEVMPQNPYENDKLDLEKYGLSHILNRRLVSLSDKEIDEYLCALANEDFSAKIPLLPIPRNIELLLSQSKCRKCGRCCLPNPLNPTYSIVEIFEDELKPIERHYHYSHKYLRKITKRGKLIKHPYVIHKKDKTRWFSLPCPFFGEKTKTCMIHEFRFTVCKVYPIILGKDTTRIEIKVNCDYGKDIFKNAIRYLKQDNGKLI